VPIYVHPKDPTKRIDILPSSRPLEVRIGNTVVAKTNFAHHLIEPMLPVRYYLSRTAVDPALLVESSLRTRCPYKGEAEYFHIKVDDVTHENLIWYYRYPTHECSAIAGALCFYNEKVEILVDGKPVKST
jgi:uncharacterized protein (DUF427 family)